MSIEVQGTVFKILKEIGGESQRGKWQKQESNFQAFKLTNSHKFISNFLRIVVR